MKGFPQVGCLRNFITAENIIVGDYTYYDVLDGPEWFESNVLPHAPGGDPGALMTGYSRGRGGDK